MTNEERIADLERRIQSLEVRNMPIGPKPEFDDEAWDRALKAICKDVKEQTGKELTVGEQIHPVPPVDRTAQTLTDGSPVTDDHRELLPSGMQKGYVVLSAEERAKGFVRPVRRTYRHKTCNTTTSMGLALAETYARDPYFYSGTFCVTCAAHFPLDQFVWEGTDEQVGT